MRSLIASLRTLILPWGATAPPRIVLDGTTGVITVFGADGNTVKITPSGVASEPEIDFGVNGIANPGYVFAFGPAPATLALSSPTSTGRTGSGFQLTEESAAGAKD